ncbi:MAG TPA: hypothetical protein VGL17_12830 [Gemmatimonadaceae bacterium]
MRVAVIIVCWLASANVGHSEPLAEVRVETTSCDSSTVSHAIERVGLSTTTSRSASVEIRPGESGTVHAEVTIYERGGSIGTRSLDGSDCTDIAAKIAIVVSVALNEHSEEPRPTPSVAAPDAVPELERSQGDNAPVRPDRLVLVVAGYEANGWASGLKVGMRARRGAVSAALGVETEFPQKQAVGGGSISIDHVGGTASVCAHAGRIGACALVDAGAVVGTGHGFGVNASAALPYADLGTQVIVTALRAGRWSLEANAAAELPVIHDRYTVDGMQVWSEPAVRLQLGFAFVTRFL